MQERCFLLELPAEIRIQIYEHIYNSKCEPVFVLRNDTSIQQPMTRWFEHPGSALLRTCKIVYHEALPAMYSMADFRLRIYIGDGWPKYQNAGPLDSTNPLIKQMQHVDITLHLVDASHIDPALQRLGLLAKAFEEAGADLKTMCVTFKAVTSYLMEVNRDLVACHRDLALKRLGEQYRAGVKGNKLFRKMLMEGFIVAIS